MYRILILSLVALLSVGCSSSKDESGGSSISLSDIKVNLAGKNYIITTKSEEKTSRTRAKNNTKSDNLLVMDEGGNIDYGIISNTKLNIQYSITDKNGDFTYLIVDENSGLDCYIIQVNMSNNALKCVNRKLGVYGISLYQNTNPFNNDYPVQFDEDGNIYFLGWVMKSSISSALKCEYPNHAGNTCLYKYTLSQDSIELIAPSPKVEIKQFTVIDSETIGYTGGKNCYVRESDNYYLCDDVGLNVISGNVIYPVTDVHPGNGDGSVQEKQHSPDYSSGNHKTLLYGSGVCDGINCSNQFQNFFEFTRLFNGSLKRSFIETSGDFINTKGAIVENDGKVYAYGSYWHYDVNSDIGANSFGLYSLLPYSGNALINNLGYCYKIDVPFYQGQGLSCGHYFSVVDNYVIYSTTKLNGNQILSEIHAVNLNDNQTIDYFTQGSDCESCYFLDKWVPSKNKIFISLVNIKNGERKFAEINRNQFSFSSSDFVINSQLNNYVNSASITDIQKVNSDSNSESITVNIPNDTNPHISQRIIFNNQMNYDDVESKITVIDNGTNTPIWFMPVWNHNTLHLLFDTDNGTSTTIRTDNLAPGHTYKITLKGTAKDSDGNSIGSDVVKYIEL